MHGSVRSCKKENRQSILPRYTEDEITNALNMEMKTLTTNFGSDKTTPSTEHDMDFKLDSPSPTTLDITSINAAFSQDTVLTQKNETPFYLSLDIKSKSLQFKITFYSSVKSWTITKTFGDFQKIDTAMSASNHFSNIPTLPSLHATSIQSYMLYLTLLMNKALYLSHPQVLAFISAPKTVRNQINMNRNETIPLKTGWLKIDNCKKLFILTKHCLKYYDDMVSFEENDHLHQIDFKLAVKEKNLIISSLPHCNTSFCIKAFETEWNMECDDSAQQKEWIESIKRIISLLKYCQNEHNLSSFCPKTKLKLHNEQTNIIDVKQSMDWRIDYEVFQWFFILFFTLIAVIDRYTTNLWPLWVDSPGPTIPGNFGVTVFSVISWISSRMLLVSSSYIFLFQCHVFWNWIVEFEVIHKFIKIADIRQSNTRLHYYVGVYFVGLPVVLHVWSILFAAAFQQNKMVLYTSWMRPQNAETELNIPFYADNVLSLGMNDVYRLISTSVSFFVLIPYSVYKVTRDLNWSCSQWMHLLGSLIYTIDLLRMYSHPHCWVFNVPFVVMWIIDRLYGIFVYRRCVANVVKKTHLDEQYMILYLRIDEDLHNLHSIGDVFWFNRLDFSNGDRAHPFTVFQNHKNFNKMAFMNDSELSPEWKGHKFSIRKSTRTATSNVGGGHGTSSKHKLSCSPSAMSMYSMKRKKSTMGHLPLVNQFNSSSSDDEEEEDEEPMNENEDKMNEIPQSNDWNLGVIIQIIPDHKHVCYERKTWTNSVSQIDFRYLCGFRAWGPFRSEYRILMKQLGDAQYPSTDLVLISSGAGCAYMIDYYQYIVANKIKLHNKVQFYFTTRSISMFQWFTDICCSSHIDNFSCNAHLTSHKNIKYKTLRRKDRDCAIGRLSFEDILNEANKATNVFFCGSPSIQKMVKRLCKKLSLKYHAGHSFHA